MDRLLSQIEGYLKWDAACFLLSLKLLCFYRLLRSCFHRQEEGEDSRPHAAGVDRREATPTRRGESPPQAGGRKEEFKTKNLGEIKRRIDLILLCPDNKSKFFKLYLFGDHPQWQKNHFGKVFITLNIKTPFRKEGLLYGQTDWLMNWFSMEVDLLKTKMPK